MAGWYDITVLIPQKYLDAKPISEARLTQDGANEIKVFCKLKPCYNFRKTRWSVSRQTRNVFSKIKVAQNPLFSLDRGKKEKNLSVPKNVIIEEENSWVKASKYICSAERETKTSISLFL